MADVFEALVGAIFIDSGYSLDTVWKVVHPLLRSYIGTEFDLRYENLFMVRSILLEGSTVHTNINPVRCFHEKHGHSITYVLVLMNSDGLSLYFYSGKPTMAKESSCVQFKHWMDSDSLVVERAIN